MKNLIIAKRYAKALFNLAREDGKIEQYGEELAGLVQLFEADPELADAIQSPSYPEAARKVDFCVALAASVSLTPIMKSLVNLLIEKNRVSNLGEINEYYSRVDR